MTCLHSHSRTDLVSQSRIQEDRICISLLIREIGEEEDRERERGRKKEEGEEDEGKKTSSTNEHSINILDNLYFSFIFLRSSSRFQSFFQ